MYYLNISSHIKQNSFLCCSVFAAVLLHADCSTIVLTIAESRVTCDGVTLQSRVTLQCRDTCGHSDPLVSSSAGNGWENWYRDILITRALNSDIDTVITLQYFTLRGIFANNFGYKHTTINVETHFAKIINIKYCLPTVKALVGTLYKKNTVYLSQYKNGRTLNFLHLESFPSHRSGN